MRFFTISSIARSYTAASRRLILDPSVGSAPDDVPVAETVEFVESSASTLLSGLMTDSVPVPAVPVPVPATRLLSTTLSLVVETPLAQAEASFFQSN